MDQGAARYLAARKRQLDVVTGASATMFGLLLGFCLAGGRWFALICLLVGAGSAAAMVMAMWAFYDEERLLK